MLAALPPFDTAVLDKHFKGATIVSIAVDEGGFTVQTTSP
jgi:methylmalonyl-CoA mutase cobalamin-binding subunit